VKKKKFRNNGAVGALLDEYEKALNELIALLNTISDKDLLQIVDEDTKDEDCKSIQTILTHVIQSGYTYAIEVRRWLGEDVNYKDKVFFNNVDAYVLALKEMFVFNEQLFVAYSDIQLIAYNTKEKLKVRWGQFYDVEQLFEHAIVHVLRHRRQIEKFLLKNRCL